MTRKTARTLEPSQVRATSAPIMSTTETSMGSPDQCRVWPLPSPPSTASGCSDKRTEESPQPQSRSRTKAPRPHLSAPPSYRAGGAAWEGEGRASQLGPAEAKFAGAQATQGWHTDGLSQEQQPRVAWGWCLASGAHVSAVTWKSVALKGVTYSWQGSRRT